MTAGRPHILITRPEEDAEPLAKELSLRGFQPVVAPMLSIRQIPDASLDLVGIRGLLFTSANGVRAFATNSDRRDYVAWCVGGATAATARKLGFKEVRTADGDVKALAELVIRNTSPTDGALLHAAGSKRAGDLAGLLSREGYTICRAVLYEAVPARVLPQNAADALKAGTVRAALFFSPRTADSFVRLVTEAGLADACRKIDAVCLSEAVAESVRQLKWSSVLISDQLNQPSMLAASQKAADRKKGQL